MTDAVVVKKSMPGLRPGLRDCGAILRKERVPFKDVSPTITLMGRSTSLTCVVEFVFKERRTQTPRDSP